VDIRNTNAALRWLLVLVLLNGLAPGIAEAIEAAVHLAETGHVAHSVAGEDDLGDQGPEHACGATLHHCDCCTASPGTEAVRTELVTPVARPSGSPDVPVRGFASRVLEPPLRPPIR
jgi:hypothetical protein